MTLRLDHLWHNIDLIAIDRNLEECAIVVMFGAVVGCRENSDEMAASKILVAILYALVCSNDELQAIVRTEFLHPIRTVFANLVPYTVVPEHQ